MASSATLGALAGNGSLALGPGQLTVGVNGASTTYAGNLSGAGGLNSPAQGAMTVIGSNSIGGNLVADGGTLQVPSGLLLTTGNIALGSSTTGTIIQTGGTVGFANTGNNYYAQIYLGEGYNSNGNYYLGGTGLLTAASGVGGQLWIGWQGGGSFTQTGGTVNLPNFGASLGWIGPYGATYALSGSGIVNIYGLTVGNSGSGAFTLSQNAQISARTGEMIGGDIGAGTFTQTGGTNSSGIILGGNPGYNGGTGGLGTYLLQGGLLVAPAASGGEFLGISSLNSLYSANAYLGGAATYFGRGFLQQTGGTNSANYIFVGGGSQYQFSGGSLQLSSPGGLQITSGGTLNGGGERTAFNVPGNSILDLSGALVNTQSMSVAVAANSLVIVPSGFNPAATFASYNISPQAVVHTLNTTLSIAAGQSLSVPGLIVDPVSVQGSLSDPSADQSIGLWLSGGLTLSAGGSVNVGSQGGVVVNSATSTMTGGTLSGESLFVGATGTGTFTQSGGSNIVTNVLLGQNWGGGSGVYLLSSSGVLHSSTESIGQQAGASFQQSGGTNTATLIRIVSYNSAANASYSLSGGLINTSYENVGPNWGTGAFNQSGGTNDVGYLSLNGPATFNFTGGLLAISSNLTQSGSYAFNFGGGTLVPGRRGHRRLT